MSPTAAEKLSPNCRCLEPDQIEATISRLSDRIEERFPGSGLSDVCKVLLEIADDATRRAEWIGQPILGLRIASAVLIALIGLGIAAMFFTVEIPADGWKFAELIQVLEAGINDLIFIALAIFFLTSVEGRIKRRRALEALHELRSCAHIIDMHQLTKDPERLLRPGTDTDASPKRTMTIFELSRYLDYCSEMLSLTGKVAALYIQNFDDPVALASVTEIENLTTGLSRKIWQKLMILHTADGEANIM